MCINKIQCIFVYTKKDNIMRSYDDWKLETPYKEESGECLQCGQEVDEGKDYCSRDCIKASYL